MDHKEIIQDKQSSYDEAERMISLFNVGEYYNNKVIAIISALTCVSLQIQQIQDWEEHNDIGLYWFFDDKMIRLQHMKSYLEGKLE